MCSGWLWISLYCHNLFLSLLSRLRRVLYIDHYQVYQDGCHLVKQVLLIFPEYQGSHMVFRSLICLPFNLRYLVIPLVSPNLCLHQTKNMNVLSPNSLYWCVINILLKYLFGARVIALKQCKLFFFNVKVYFFSYTSQIRQDNVWKNLQTRNHGTKEWLTCIYGKPYRMHFYIFCKVLPFYDYIHWLCSSTISIYRPLHRLQN